MAVKETTIKDLIPDDQNFNKGNEFGESLIEKSFSKFGAGRSILLDKNNQIIAGNKSTQKFVEQGGQKVLVVETDGETLVAVKRTDIDLNTKRGREMALADNAAAKANIEWDFEVLPDWFDSKELDDWGVIDFSLSEEETETQDAEHQIDKAEELNKKWKVATGDLWAIGEHRLLCGDSTKRGHLDFLLNSERIRLIVTSPPYNQKLDQFKPSGMHKEHNWVSNVQSGSYFDSKPESDYQSEQIESIKVWSDFVTDDASMFYNHKNRYRDKEVLSPWGWLEKTAVKVRQEIIWKRPGSVTQNARMFLPCDERIYWMYFGDDFYFDDSTEIKTWSSVWEINPHIDSEQSLHGCAFPIELPLRAIKSCSVENDVVFDPYCGSGTTMIAAENLKRRCFGMEISPNYCAVILERMSTAFPGLEIKRIERGESAGV